ncbi:uncharacterized protein YdiU (UPF0061 family) [Alkalibaculum bacchi]|uniref:Protein nucleotidyltransferase YdiU n=2 Tax=Alkalibaculum bacchi TaxID=645887 RepID=A0A366HZM2_9FIRM|nr:YdiU family protein [Alkalibaculum bacchi]RBP59068.1 uncharacterized protein YdiU (UPF0061 family) [Alkalibaculum bacchi]
MEKDKHLEIGWNFDNTYSLLPEFFYSKVEPNPVDSPKLVVLNQSVANLLGLDVHALEREEGIHILAGNSLPKGALSIAQAYAGHQFGYFTILGDGRAMLIGEQITPARERYDIQLKGSGRTKFSRGGDGRAALGPMLREYIISEAMHYLGIPTTRSLAVVATGETVRRERNLSGAILTRVASSHIRVGTIQFASKYGSREELDALVRYSLKRHYPSQAASANSSLTLLEEVCKVQAELIARWQLVGFIHGVMNTDNMTISGETIDYGPCAFMDTYDPKTVFSSIDTNGRYAYENQPVIGNWNLCRLAEAMLPLIDENQDKAIKLAQAAIEKYDELYHVKWLEGMRKKLGLTNIESEDESLVEELLSIMHKYKADYTNTFVSLTFNQIEGMALMDKPEFVEWHKKWQSRLGRQGESKESIRDLMKNNNPAIIPRNHRVEEALESAEKGDYNVIKKLLDVLSRPYDHNPDQKEYATLPPASSCSYRTFCGT